MSPFRTQLDEWQPRIKGLAWHRIRKGGCHVALDDLVQVGRIGLWRAVERYDGVREFEPFAVRTIYCHMLAEIRGHDCLKAHVRAAGMEKVVHVNIDDVSESELQDPRTPCDALEISQARKFLPLLPESWQRVIEMRYDQELDWAAIGAATGQGGDAAKQMCHRAQKKLRSWMAGRWRPLAKHAGRRTT